MDAKRTKTINAQTRPALEVSKNSAVGVRSPPKYLIGGKMNEDYLKLILEKLSTIEREVTVLRTESKYRDEKVICAERELEKNKTYFDEEMKSLGKRVDTLERDANTFLTAKSIILWVVTIAITMFGILYKK